MKHKVKQTKFESFSKRFLLISLVIFVFGIFGVKSFESSYNRQIQKLQKEIKNANNDIDSLEVQKQELASFPRLNSVANERGYTYSNDSVATSTSEQANQ